MDYDDDDDVLVLPVNPPSFSQGNNNGEEESDEESYQQGNGGIGVPTNQAAEPARSPNRGPHGAAVCPYCNAEFVKYSANHKICSETQCQKRRKSKVKKHRQHTKPTEEIHNRGRQIGQHGKWQRRKPQHKKPPAPVLPKQTWSHWRSSRRLARQPSRKTAMFDMLAPVLQKNDTATESL